MCSDVLQPCLLTYLPAHIHPAALRWHAPPPLKALGALAAGPLADSIGPRGAQAAVCGVFAAGAAATATAPGLRVFLLARLLSGVGALHHPPHHLFSPNLPHDPRPPHRTPPPGFSSAVECTDLLPHRRWCSVAARAPLHCRGVTAAPPWQLGQPESGAAPCLFPCTSPLTSACPAPVSGLIYLPLPS